MSIRKSSNRERTGQSGLRRGGGKRKKKTKSGSVKKEVMEGVEGRTADQRSKEKAGTRVGKNGVAMSAGMGDSIITAHPYKNFMMQWDNLPCNCGGEEARGTEAQLSQRNCQLERKRKRLTFSNTGKVKGVMKNFQQSERTN